MTLAGAAAQAAPASLHNHERVELQDSGAFEPPSMERQVPLGYGVETAFLKINRDCLSDYSVHRSAEEIRRNRFPAIEPIDSPRIPALLS
ncbi:protein of unknown function [Nitrospira defluvii]|uniref:Uncharacterized protein n=1 Tax=Nitrospira defluvii TaxID=330214 RepID=D8P7L9_9BACT|nr:protein of unknown function [Nitrospira defluvii]